MTFFKWLIMPFAYLTLLIGASLYMVAVAVAVGVDSMRRTRSDEMQREDLTDNHVPKDFKA
jgi:hypothetical protein